ncbi:response regulator [Ramlibacter sp.]|uniref:response regulator n=1 Tax=Ramlibacter sp. TaxID=1917967 RepID=UPI003D0FD501
MRSEHTILVVDDHPAALYAASRLLQSAGFRTLEAASGTDALRLAGRASAVLIDVNLPDVNGVQVCQTIKNAPETKHVPVILMSAVYLDELHRGAGLSAGADGYLTPPFEGEQLAALLDGLVAGKA